jgi:hypothetical protein
MIKKTELRIGNYIDYERTTHVVTRLLAHHVSHDWYKSIGEDAYDTSYDSINPIPLTPEILEKCGFKRMSSDWRWKGIFFIYYKANEEVWECVIEESYASKAITTIKYLHQLQNLYFALTNKELIINL